MRSLSVALLFSAVFWIADSAYGYFMFAQRMRHLLFKEPLTFFDALLFSISPQDLFVRIAFTVTCLTAGLMIAVQLSRLKAAESQLRIYSEHLEELVAARSVELEEAQSALIQQQTLATLGRLAGALGHELRNPLGVISNAIYYLGMTHSDDRIVEEYTHIVKAEVATASRIIAGLLTFAETSTPQRVPVLVATLVEHSLQVQCPPDNVEVIIAVDSELGPIEVDPIQLSEALSQILLTAYRAMPDGGQVVICDDHITGLDDDQVRISITDTGVGITPDDLPHLFEPLFTSKYGGLGLGLAIAKSLIERNGGTVEAENAASGGSVFAVTLPMAETRS